MSLSIVILAAGQGTRMRSDLPKVLHPLGGKPLLAHVLDTAQSLGAGAIHVVHGHGGDVVRDALADYGVNWVEQARQLGTGHAVAQALPAIADTDLVLILYGDVPLIQPETLQRLCAAADGGIGLLTAHLKNPTGYGRILRTDAGPVTAIVEQKDASPDELLITEINTGFLAAPAAALRRWIGALRNDNAQGEYYLTDVIAAAVADGVPVHTVVPHTHVEILGVNDRIQLAALETEYRRRQAEILMRDGVTVRDPARFDLRGRLRAGRDVTIDVGVIIEGDVELGDRVHVGPYSLLRNVRVGADTVIRSHCVLDGAEVGRGARIGPFARLRPESRLGPDSHVGNFVEIKKSDVGEASKINHLSYIGDATVGSRVNVGAGTITCNYDGANKHRTVIGDDAFIGSDTQLVAPVTVGAGATIGAGSTITRDAPAGELTLSRVRQETRPGWQRPTKNAK